MTLPPLTLILGGARSGKSRMAEGLIGTRPAIYVATAQAFDDEMVERLRLHRERRGPNWLTVEEPLDLAQALQRNDSGKPILVDCLTLWLTNVILAERDVATEVERLCAILEIMASPVILVANEVGLGIVPDTPLGRTFRDHAGLLNQWVAAIAQTVIFVAAGLPLVLKDHR